MPDSTGKECYECHEKFTTFRRRHHCRLCGQIFCAKCTSHQINGSIIGELVTLCFGAFSFRVLGYSGVLRLCGYCAQKVDVYCMNRQYQGTERPELFGSAQSSPEQGEHDARGTDSVTSSPDRKGTECAERLSFAKKAIFQADCATEIFQEAPLGRPRQSQCTPVSRQSPSAATALPYLHPCCPFNISHSMKSRS